MLTQIAFLVLLCVGYAWSSAVESSGEENASTRIQIIHLSDVHGWIYGHTHQPELNANFGDLYSFIKHMDDLSDELMIFDSGDLVEGTGLSDATPVHGEYIFPVIAELPYDALTIGNHDLAHNDTIEMLQSELLDTMGHRYVTTNTLLTDTGNPLGSCYYTTKIQGGYKLLVFGFMYDFDQAASMTTIVYMKDAVKSACFVDAMEKHADADLIVTLNHIDPDEQNATLQIQYQAIRAKFPRTPYIMLTGHRHVTFFERYDEYCFAIESGKYFEIFGLIEFNMKRDSNGQSYWTDLETSWQNTSLANMYYLSKTTNETFNTTKGVEITEQIETYYNSLGLNELVGCAPITFNPYSNYYTASDSFYNLYVNFVIPSNYVDNSPDGAPFFISNAAALRSYLYEGPVILNDLYSIAPFNDSFYNIPNVNGTMLQAIQSYLDTAPTGAKMKSKARAIIEQYHDPSFFDQFDMSVINRHECGAGPEPANTTNWYYQKINIEQGTLYDIISCEYDSYVISLAVADLYPNFAFDLSLYKGIHPKIRSTGLLKEYVSINFPCSSDGTTFEPPVLTSRERQMS